jgi:hypothetical protein
MACARCGAELEPTALDHLARRAFATAACTDVLEARQLPESIRGDATAVVDANNQFACDVYGKLGAQPGNLVFSPLHRDRARDARRRGRRANRRRIPRRAHITLPGEQMHAAYRAFREPRRRCDYGAYTLATADRLFGQNSRSCRTT